MSAKFSHTQLVQLAAVTALVVRDPVEKSLVVALREIGADADAILSDQADHVIERFDVIVDGGLGAALQERREHGHADEAAVLGDETQLLVAFVARMRLQP